MTKSTRRSLVLISALLCPFATIAETAVDGVEIVPLFLNDAGDGILRYTDPTGSGHAFTIATGGITDSTVRPFEVFGAFAGPLSGPEFTFCVQQFAPDRVPDSFGFEVYNTVTQKPVLRYRLVFDAMQAEEITAIGDGAAPGECSTNFVR